MHLTFVAGAHSVYDGDRADIVGVVPYVGLPVTSGAVVVVWVGESMGVGDGSSDDVEAAHEAAHAIACAKRDLLNVGEVTPS